MTYGSETRPLLVDVGLKFERAEMQMIRWICGISLKDVRTNEEWRSLCKRMPWSTLSKAFEKSRYTISADVCLPFLIQYSAGPF